MRDRDSTRLFSHNYAWKGWYFVTINTHSKDHIFGEISHGSMILNEFGEKARKEWIKTEHIRRNIEIDEFIIMPDHIHGLIKIKFEITNNHTSLPGNKDGNVLKDNFYRGVLPGDNKGVLLGDGKGILQYALTINLYVLTSNFAAPSAHFSGHA